jgi:hypothetical protein
MRLPRDLINSKIDALVSVLPGLLVGATGAQRCAELDELTASLLEQCHPEDREHVRMRLGELSRQLGMPPA